MISTTNSLGEGWGVKLWLEGANAPHPLNETLLVYVRLCVLHAIDRVGELRSSEPAAWLHWE